MINIYGGRRMKLLFKQRLFSWFDSYDIYDEYGNVIYTVKGELSWGHKLCIYDNQGLHIGTIKEEVLTLLPKFKMYINDQYIGQIKKEFTLFKPSFILDCNNWQITGDFLEWNYEIIDDNGVIIGDINKEIFNLTDTYSLNINSPQNALYVLMIVLAIDAQKCSNNK
jgi:uncharacterized protein YxjI